MSNSELKMVSIKDILIGKNNPRKSFDEKELAELTESIKQHGILQPILIRPKGKKYELVCGERRFRAAISAKLEEMPVNIRTLTDDEAFELQIIENLERKDVHPLDEAEAFKKMLDSGKYKIEDIAAKVAKSETFIAQRLHLVNLIDEVKIHFTKGVIGIGHAILIARLNNEKQMKIYNDSKSGWNVDEENPHYGTVAELKDEISDETYLLEDAPFPLITKNLIKGVDACSICPKRTGTNPVLFADMQSEDRCMDTSCYDKKLNAYTEREVANIINENQDIQFAMDYNGSMTNTIKSILKQYKITPLKNYDDWISVERNGWEKRRVFNVSDGKYQDVFLKPKKENSENKGASGDASKKEEIKKLQDRAARALELDNVKVFTAIKNDEGLFKTYKSNEDDLSGIEIKALWYLFKREVAGWGIIQEYNKMIGCPDSYNSIEEFNFYRNSETSNLKINTLVRMAIIDKLSQMHEPNYDKCTRSRFLFEIMKEKNSGVVKQYEDSQKEIADKRIERTNSKIEKLKAELK